MIRREEIESLTAAFDCQLEGPDALCLYAGANLASPRAKKLLGSSLGQMPAMGDRSVREQPGVGPVVEIESKVEDLACELFSATWAEVRLPSCTLANLALYASYCSPGDTIMVQGARGGSHVSHMRHGAPGIFGLRIAELPFDVDAWAPHDVQGAHEILRTRPRLVLIGASYVPRSFSFTRIAEAAREVGAILAYDAAHIAGLIAGGAFPNPLANGADLMTMSTYKSLGGPPGGVIVGKGHELEKSLRPTIYPRLTANYDAARVAALGISLAEAHCFMSDYARAMIENANALAGSLETFGVDVLHRDTHHLAIPIGNPEEARHAMMRFEDCGILTGTTAIPQRPGVHGLRLGTQLITRRGFTKAAMIPVAELIKDALDPQQGGAEVRSRSADLSGRFVGTVFH